MKIKKHKSIVNLSKIKKFSVTKDKFKEKVTNFLELPTFMIGESSRISIVDNKQIFVEGKVAVEDYLNHYIKLKMSKMSLAIEGRNLAIKEMNDRELVIDGDIVSITYDK